MMTMMMMRGWGKMAKKSLWRDFVQAAVNPHLLRLSFFQIEDGAADHDHDHDGGGGGDDDISFK